MKWEDLPFYILLATVIDQENFQLIYCQEMTTLYGAPGCDETVLNLSSFQKLNSLLYHSRLQNCLKYKRDSVQRRVDSNSPLGGFPSSGHCRNKMIKTALFLSQQLAILRSSAKLKPSIQIELSRPAHSCSSALHSTCFACWPVHPSHSQLHPNIQFIQTA